jgi:hypothetical protein
MPQHVLDFWQLCAPLQHASRQAMPQHMGSGHFQPSCYVLEFLSPSDVSLTLCFRSELSRCLLSQGLNRSLCNALRNPWPGWLPFHGHIDPHQE